MRCSHPSVVLARDGALMCIRCGVTSTPEVAVVPMAQIASSTAPTSAEDIAALIEAKRRATER